MTKLNKALGTDLASIAELLRSKGRGKDTMLAHITPKEAALLKRRGGSGSINPETGLPEFEDSGDYSFEAPAPVSPVYDVVQPSGQFQPTTDTGAIPNASYTPGTFDTSAVAPIAPIAPVAPTAPVAYDPMQAGQEGFTYTGPAGQQIAPSQTAFTPDGKGMSGADILAYQQGNYPVSTATGAEAGAKPEKSYGERALSALTDPSTLAKLGLATGLGLYGASRARQGGSQVQAVTGQQQTIASPYQKQGSDLIQQAQQGVLSPSSQQAYNAAKAQLEQGKANRGGVGSQQASAQLADTYQRLIDNQYNYGLKVMQIGDNIALGAIKSGLTLDQNLNASTTNFYTQLASIVGGMQLPQSSGTQLPVRG